MDNPARHNKAENQEKTYTRLDESDFVDDEYKRGGKIHQISILIVSSVFQNNLSPSSHPQSATLENYVPYQITPLSYIFTRKLDDSVIFPDPNPGRDGPVSIPSLHARIHATHFIPVDEAQETIRKSKKPILDRDR